VAHGIAQCHVQGHFKKMVQRSMCHAKQVYSFLLFVAAKDSILLPPISAIFVDLGRKMAFSFLTNGICNPLFA
jgi:hypothetical protein